VTEDANTFAAMIAAAIAAFAAIASALISAWFNLSNSRRAASQRLAEMRQIWIEDLRNHIADFVGTVCRIMNVCTTKEYPQENKQTVLEGLNSTLMRLESYISLKLNHEEKAPARLVNVIKHSRGASAYISRGADIADFLPRTIGHLGEIDEVSRFIFKTEWDRASDEIRPASRNKRHEREIKMNEWYRRIPDTCTMFETPSPSGKH
jgi:hypothetical protein